MSLGLLAQTRLPAFNRDITRNNEKDRMENETGAVNETAETTAPVESAPIEKETVDTSKESADTTVEPKKVSDSVPYERFKEVNDRLSDPEFILKKAQELGVIQAQTPMDYVPPAEMANETPFDQDTERNLDQWYERRRENERAQEFVLKHADELKDPFVAARTQQIIREKNAAGQRADQEAALAQAQKELNSRLTPEVTKAKAEGEKEGLEVAGKKELMGAVGTAASKQEFDEKSLSSKEYAEYHGLKYVQ